MANPQRGVYLNNNFYNFQTGSYTRNINLRKDAETTQNTITFSILNNAPAEHSIILILENTYTERQGSVEVGSTTWLGISRLADLVNFTGALGVSMPIQFTSPDGVSQAVVPIGSLDISEFNPEQPPDAGIEYRVSLTLRNVI